MNEKDKATAKQIVKRYLDNDINDYQLENQFATALITVRQEAERTALIQAARDVCLYCGGRAAAFYFRVAGPNEAGNFTHQHRTDKEAQALCRASAIYTRLAAATTSPETPVGGEPQNQDMETCPVCKNLVPLDSMFSYNNVPNAFCQGCVDSGRVGGND